MKEVDKCIVPIQEIVPLPTVTKVEVKSSEERKPGSDTKSTTVTVEEDVPLSGLNMQLKKVQGDACKTVDKVQRWSLFQTQCIIKGKACKLMIDGGSCTNGISKAMVAALGLSTWRDAAPPIVDATPWPRSPPSGPTTQNPAIYVKVNSFLSMVNLNTNLNGMLPHAYHHCVYRYRHRQGPREKELPWCKEEGRRRMKEEGRKRKKMREEEDQPVTGPVDRAPDRTARHRPGLTGLLTGPPVENPVNRPPDRTVRRRTRPTGRKPDSRPRDRSDRPPDRTRRRQLRSNRTTDRLLVFDID
ncbi:hypothetical protein QYE76_017195 [Lolium multiflorum]|uniref:Uncharacterized protein n=1 Tax=Lolium multiflorum TaxID=4521 RepID=A0AAD8QGL8_LOLMU|nr:hypothetical protein QYE76_017195 [Lolium multiflorum]